MTSQPTTDIRIDQVLDALRSTEAPAGMEERIAQRLAARMQHTDARSSFAATTSARRTNAASFFAVILNAVGVPGSRSLPAGVRGKAPRILPAQAKLYATAATALTLLVTLSILHNHTTTTSSVATTEIAQGFSLGSHRVDSKAGVSTPAHSTLAQSTTKVPISNRSHTALIESAATTQVPQGFSLGSHTAQKVTGVFTPASDPDAIALAETRAPSLAAPPPPLTHQEQLLADAVRPGQPIQLAELEKAREPFVQADAKARSDEAIRRYVHAMLAPFAVADALQPTTFAEPQEISTTAPAPHPPISLSN